MTTSSVIHSNAFNFMSFLMLGVDPRTGQYTVTVDLPELKSNRLCGPAVPLQLQFNPLNLEDSGFGVGWNLSLSQYTPVGSMLALSTGENFKVTGSGAQPAIKEKKLDSFHFYNLGADTYRVVHKSGLVETLVTGGSGDKRVALPREIRAPSGHAVNLTYTSFQGGQLLETVRDAFTPLLRIERDPNNQFVRLHLHPDSGPGGTPLASFEMRLNGRQEVTSIILPTAENASWRFTYEQIRGHTCLVKVQTPVGGEELIEYRDGGHPYPNPSAPLQHLPRVTRHTTVPGFGQPDIVVDYTYTTHNFLGNGAAINWLNDGLDNLYRVQTDYEYGSVEALKVGSITQRSVTRTFNRFHLLTEEVTRQGDCVKTVGTDYHSEDVDFDLQPPQFQLPKTVTTRWTRGNQSRTEVESTSFDEYGNLTEQVQASGIRETFSYYPKEGDDGCPADPEGFERNLRTKTVYPAASDDGTATALQTVNRYEALPALDSAADAPNWLVVTRETLTDSDDNHFSPLQYIERVYHNEPDEPSLHGRPKSQNETFNEKTTTTVFAYSAPLSRLAGEIVDQTVETLTGFDATTKVVTRQHSMLSGEVLLDHDNDTDVQISYEYDVLQRVTLETVAPGDPEFEAARAYRYTLTSAPGQQASQEVVDVKGVTTRTKVDGLNRPILEERQDADSTTPARYRRTYAATYDLFGNIANATDYDWLGERELGLHSRYEYDDWGQQSCVTGPDRVKEFTQTDPTANSGFGGPVTRSWRQGPDDPDGNHALGGVTETSLNLFEKPARVERFDTDDKSISVHQYFYDGLGRTAKEIDARNATTLYAYDAFDRLLESTLPGGDVVKRIYAPHTDDDLPVGISVNDIELGTQVFDGVGRKTQATIGGRLQTFSYETGHSQPKTVTTASGRTITYTYSPALGDEPLTRELAEDVSARYEYDKKNARLLSCGESDQVLERTWFSTGELKTETRTQAGGDPLSMEYVYSLNGRLREYKDVLGQTQYSEYDDFGRLESVELGTINSTFTYNELGWLNSITTKEGARTVGITLAYDDFGRETQREFDLNGVVQTLDQVYNANDAAEKRTLKEGDELLREEGYQYDPRGRLVRYTCSGSQPPVDPYGQALVRQVFIFDALDNLTEVRTTSAVGTNTATYDYGALDPVQLQKVTNSDTVHYPAEILLDYDADGNLILDEQQRTLTYDPLGRLIAVSANGDDGARNYQYDPLDRVANDGPADTGQQRFYREDKLANQVGGTLNRTFIHGGDNLVAERQNPGATKNVLLATDRKRSVTGEVPDGHPPNDIAYNAYGRRSATRPIVSALAFNGELTEDSGWQLLGNGYRAYNPVLMRFHSPDNLSPFGEGGVNGYAYCQGDPVNRSDPTGHFALLLVAAVSLAAGVAALVGASQTENKTTKMVLQVAGSMAVALGVVFGVWGVVGGRSPVARDGAGQAAWMGGRNSSVSGRSAVYTKRGRYARNPHAQTSSTSRGRSRAVTEGRAPGSNSSAQPGLPLQNRGSRARASPALLGSVALPGSEVLAQNVSSVSLIRAGKWKTVRPQPGFGETSL